MKKSALPAACALILCVMTGLPFAGIYSLYTDHRAMMTDDILTVMIVESAKAGSQSGTNTKKQHGYGIDNVKGSGLLSAIPAFGASGGTKMSFDGQAGTKREGSLVATVSARIIRVMDNGNLIIEGSKTVEINDEREIIKITGTVRPQDIETNNIVYSSSIADAQITYSGKGVVNAGQRQGLISKFLNLIF
jgi:flagellar L-ring protein precursor FlgH